MYKFNVCSQRYTYRECLGGRSKEENKMLEKKEGRIREKKEEDYKVSNVVINLIITFILVEHST